MGASTERYTEKLGLTRQAQDAFAAASHQRAGQAATSGAFDDEIAPVSIPQRTGDPVVVSTDEGVRPDSTAETLARLQPSFAEGGHADRGELVAAERRRSCPGADQPRERGTARA